MRHSARVHLTQLNFLVGDIAGNTQKILDTLRNSPPGDILVFPELALSGYPPEDLLLRDAFHQQLAAALTTITGQTRHHTVVLGYPHSTPQGIYNAAAVLQAGKCIGHYDKQHLPNYGVFDEKRYFIPGNGQPCVVDMHGIPTGILICEDIWFPTPFQEAVLAGAQRIICINASPFHEEKHRERLKVLRQRLQEHPIPIFYVNHLGAQDEIVFDGDSMVLDPTGNIVESLGTFPHIPGEGVYAALVLGVRDYVHKNGFSDVLIGLSGGIDSALTLAIATDALGKTHVQAVIMPSRYTSQLSLELAEQQAKLLGINARVISIDGPFQAFIDALGLTSTEDITAQNLQARCRAMCLMALSNQTGALVLNTGNKSELAVGYTTLYGDMAGGFGVLKDVWKTRVFELAHYRNTLGPVIPEAVLHRAPTAELAPHQTDQETLPPYAILDGILQRYVEQNKNIEAIIAEGFEENTVRQVVRLLLRNEYKRRQAPPGIKITRCAFGRERRYPMTSGYTG